MKTETPQTENVPAVVQPPLVQLFEMLGRTIYAKVTGHIGCGEGDEWCEEVMEEATKLGLCQRMPYDPDLHGEMEFVPHEDYIWWWGFLPEGWQTTKPPRSASSIREKVETERWFFIADWCKKNGISPMNADNFNRAAMEWAKLNCFEPNSQDQPPKGSV